ncbi:phosphotransferase [Psychromonas sp. MME2]|uniref:phosphotransferase n=1 Tax=unclassified Psychromonas TaxID=2614957 RepID=UPI00339C179D
MPISELLEDEINWLAKRPLGRCISITALDNALTNKVFLLCYEDRQRYIFKRLNRVARSRQQRETELLVQQLACEYQLSPNVIMSSDHYRLQEYIHGDHLPTHSIPSTTLDLLALQLSRIHQLPAIAIGQQNLAEQLQRLKIENDTSDEMQFNHYLQLAKQLDSSGDHTTLCHGDLSLNNILLTPQGDVKVIDWEYAVLASPAYDVGSCSAINQLSVVQEVKLIEEYYLLNECRVSAPLAQFQADCHAYRSLFTYLNQLWKKRFL